MFAGVSRELLNPSVGNLHFITPLHHLVANVMTENWQMPETNVESWEQLGC